MLSNVRLSFLKSWREFFYYSPMVFIYWSLHSLFLEQVYSFLCYYKDWFTLFFLVLNINYQCPFKLLFHLSCPGCGLTRAFKEILHLNLLNSLSYNLLGIPLFIIFILSIILLIKDIIKKEDKFYYQFINFVKKYYIIILIILFLNMIINNL